MPRTDVPAANAGVDRWRRDMTCFPNITLIRNEVDISHLALVRIPELTHGFLALSAKAIERCLDQRPRKPEVFAKAHWLAHAYNTEFERISKTKPDAIVGLEPINLAPHRSLAE